MDETLYQKWFDFTASHLPKKTETILELACGTGALACKFARAGFQVTALDLSEEMLMIAYNRAIAEDVEVTFMLGDMLDLDASVKYQAITCFSDSLCYMKDERAVQQVFDGVANALAGDGVFIFDVHSIYKVDELFPDYSFHENEEDFAFLWDSYPGDTAHSIVHELTFFVKDEDNNFKRFDEIHRERTYELNFFLQMLESSGFDNVQVFADFENKAPTPTSERLFFVCRKYSGG
ncbi:MAG: class I SAM-dependent methyltransferase [Streptococcaceae bacterium]|jgi:SAM-dependent methyltransferase|nr:class I SAM-dependent methyltransferase [Streptococcaceae bacterium]